MPSARTVDPFEILVSVLPFKAMETGIFAWFSSFLSKEADVGLISEFVTELSVMATVKRALAPALNLKVSWAAPSGRALRYPLWMVTVVPDTE
ncbi:hypothetical protein D3C76_1540160 [compost metagenome]